MSSTIERDYLRSLRDILEYGEEKHPERKLEAGRKLSHHTKGVTDLIFTHYMDEGFPLFTHKKMGLKSIAIELEFFIKGLTDKQWLKDRGCNIWNEWANPVKVGERLLKNEDSIAKILAVPLGGSKELAEQAEKEAKLEENDLGPIYGYQWRRFGEHYGELYGPEHNAYYGLNGVRPGEGKDQLKEIIDTLKNNPNDRRMVCSAWNPNQFEIMALPPCHLLWGVSHYNGCLDLRFIARSTDALLGWPYNIASYGLLLLLLAKESGLKARKLTAISFDYHLYSNQFEAAKQAINRPIFPLPKVEITGDKSIFDWTYNDFILKDYKCNEPLEKVEVVI